MARSFDSRENRVPLELQKLLPKDAPQASKITNITAVNIGTIEPHLEQGVNGDRYLITKILIKQGLKYYALPIVINLASELKDTKISQVGVWREKQPEFTAIAQGLIQNGKLNVKALSDQIENRDPIEVSDAIALPESTQLVAFEFIKIQP